MFRKSFLSYLLLILKCSLIVTHPLEETEINNAAAPASLFVDDSQQDFNYDGRIVGGQMTSIFLYPFQVSLQYRKSHHCGGSILTPNIILTAAHCIGDAQDVDPFQVRAGSTTHLFGGQVVGVSRIIKHEAYNLSDFNNDVALVFLSRNLTFSRRVRPIELAAFGDDVPNNKTLFVSGWGLTSETGAVANFLNHVGVKLMNQSNCEESYRYVATITTQMFCAGLPEGGKDSCQGDSGGPLVSYVRAPASPSSLTPKSEGGQSTTSSPTLTPTTVKPIQYGIVSFGVGCAQKGYPGVYANVAALRPWIDERIREMTNLN